MVPSGFEWPQGVTVNIMWNLWFFGETQRNIGPYRHIHPKDDLKKTKCKVRRTRCYGVINKLVNIAIRGNKMTRIRDVVVQNSQAIFVYSFEKLVILAYEKPRRPEDLVIDSFYERLRIKNLLIDDGAVCSGSEDGSDCEDEDNAV